MPYIESQYYQTTVVSAYHGERLLLADYPVAANEVISEYALVAQVQNASASDVQTLTGTATSGTITIQFGGYITAPISATATAAVVQAALQSLSNVGVGGYICSGEALGTDPVVCTASGALANQPQPLMVINNGLAVGGTVTPAHTTQGVAQNAIVNYNGAMAPNPTTAPTVTAGGADGTWAAGDYTVAYTYVTAGGETLPSYEADVLLVATNHIAIASIAEVPTGVLSVNVYVNGLFAKNQAVTSGATGAFTITGPAGAADATPPPHSSTAFIAGDGSQIPIGIAYYSMATGPNGQVTYGGQSLPAGGNQYGVPGYTGNVVICGFILASNINAVSPLDTNSVKTLGRFTFGSLSNLTNAVLAIYGA